MENLHNSFSNFEFNPREIIRRSIKIIFLVLILYLSLTSTNRLDNKQIIQIMCFLCASCRLGVSGWRSRKYTQK